MLGSIFNFFKRLGKNLFVLLSVSMVFLAITVVSCELLNPQEDGNMDLVEEEAEETQGDEIAGIGKEETRIRLWDCLEPKGRLALMKSIEDFTGNTENIYIEIESEHFRSQEELEDRYEAASLAGAGPELVLVSLDGVQRLVPENVIKEVTEDTAGEIDYSFFLDGLVEISGYGGKNYAIPFRSYDFLVFFYNRDIIENPPERFEELISYCKEVNNPAEDVYGFLMNSSEADWIIPFIGGYGDWIVEYSYDSLTLESESTARAMEFLNYLYNEEKILPRYIEYGEIKDLFKSGNVHMIIDSVGMIEEYSEAGLNYGLAKIPRVWQGNGYPTPLISGLGFMINVNCYGNELEAVNEFLEFMLTEEEQIEWTSSTDTFPVLKDIDKNDVIKNDSIIYNAFMQAELCRGKPYEELIMVIRDSLSDNSKSVISGDLLPADAASKIQEDALRLRSGGTGLEETEESGNTEEIKENEEAE